MAQQQIVENPCAVNDARKHRGVSDQDARLMGEVDKLWVFPDIVAVCLATSAAGQKRQQATRLMRDQPIYDELGFVEREIEVCGLQQVLGNRRQGRCPDLKLLGFGSGVFALANAVSAVLEVAHGREEIVD